MRLSFPHIGYTANVRLPRSISYVASVRSVPQSRGTHVYVRVYHVYRISQPHMDGVELTSHDAMAACQGGLLSFYRHLILGECLTMGSFCMQ